MLPGSSDSKTITVLLVDDHPAIRAGLRAALGSEPGITVAGEASDGVEAEELALRLRPDVILMDIFMPIRGGLESIISIKQKIPDVRVLMLTVSEEDDDLFQAIRFGADGYLLKKSDLKDIATAVREIMQDRSTLSPEMAVRLMREIKAEQEKAELSGREKEVLKFLAEGLTALEISERLSLSQSTVNTYVHRLLEKLHLKNRAQAIAYSARHTSPPPAHISPDNEILRSPGESGVRWE